MAKVGGEATLSLRAVDAVRPLMSFEIAPVNSAMASQGQIGCPRGNVRKRALGRVDLTIEGFVFYFPIPWARCRSARLRKTHRRDRAGSSLCVSGILHGWGMGKEKR